MCSTKSPQQVRERIHVSKPYSESPGGETNSATKAEAGRLYRGEASE